MTATIDETRKKLLNCVESASADGVELALDLDVFFVNQGRGRPCLACLLGTALADQDNDTLGQGRVFIQRAANALGISFVEASALEDGFEHGEGDEDGFEHVWISWLRLGAEFRQIAQYRGMEP